MPTLRELHARHSTTGFLFSHNNHGAINIHYFPPSLSLTPLLSLPYLFTTTVYRETRNRPWGWRVGYHVSFTPESVVALITTKPNWAALIGSASPDSPTNLFTRRTP